MQGAMLPVELIDVFETKWEARVVKAVVMNARPGVKLTCVDICNALDVPANEVTAIKRGLRQAIENGTLVVVALEGKKMLRTYAPGPKLAGLVWAQSVPESDNRLSGDLGTECARPLSDSGTKCAQNDESRAQSVPEFGHKVGPNGNGTPVAVLGTKNSEFSKPLLSHTARAREEADAPYFALFLAYSRVCFEADDVPVGQEQAVRDAVTDAVKHGVTPEEIRAMRAEAWRHDDPPRPKQVVAEVLRHRATRRHTDERKAARRVKAPALEPLPERLSADVLARTARPRPPLGAAPPANGERRHQ